MILVVVVVPSFFFIFFFVILLLVGKNRKNELEKTRKMSWKKQEKGDPARTDGEARIKDRSKNLPMMGIEDKDGEDL